MCSRKNFNIIFFIFMFHDLRTWRLKRKFVSYKNTERNSKNEEVSYVRIRRAIRCDFEESYINVSKNKPSLNRIWRRIPTCGTPLYLHKRWCLLFGLCFGNKLENCVCLTFSFAITVVYVYLREWFFSNRMREKSTFDIEYGHVKHFFILDPYTDPFNSVFIKIFICSYAQRTFVRIRVTLKYHNTHTVYWGRDHIIFITEPFDSLSPVWDRVYRCTNVGRKTLRSGTPR